MKSTKSKIFWTNSKYKNSRRQNRIKISGKNIWLISVEVESSIFFGKRIFSSQNQSISKEKLYFSTRALSRKTATTMKFKNSGIFIYLFIYFLELILGLFVLRISGENFCELFEFKIV